MRGRLFLGGQCARSWGRAIRGSAFPGYTVNALMENRHRILLGIGVEVFRSVGSERDGCAGLLARARRRLRFTPQTLGADKGFFEEKFIEHLLDRGIQPHIAPDRRGRRKAHTRVRMRVRGACYKLLPRCRKKIEELFGEAKPAMTATYSQELQIRGPPATAERRDFRSERDVKDPNEHVQPRFVSSLLVKGSKREPAGLGPAQDNAAREPRCSNARRTTGAVLLARARAGS